jgi:pimeloyl-ACP methyl ester carboxylesterase
MTQEGIVSYLKTKTQEVTASNGTTYKFRETGPSDAPRLLLLQHFRGNLENWDPALIDALATERRVVVFDNTGVGGTDGTTPTTITQMADDALAFCDARELTSTDLLGFSIGSFVSQEIALTRASLVRRLVLASTAPQGAPGMHGWAQSVIEAVGQREGNAEGFLAVFFRDTETSQEAGRAFLGRMYSRTDERDPDVGWASLSAQYDAVLKWGTPNFSMLGRLSAIKQPVFVANGDADPMILPWYTHLTAALLPDARVKIYPDSAHGFLFQHATEFSADVLDFLMQEIETPARPAEFK